MRLIQLSANKESFHTVQFHPTGVTVIAARQSHPNTSDRAKTYNGVGKSLIIALIHFCLGRTPKDAYAEALPGWEFSLSFLLNETEYKATRTTDNQSEIILNDQAMPYQEFQRWLCEEIFGKTPSQTSELTLSSLLGRFIRPSKRSYVDCRQLHDHDQPNTYRSLINNAYLLGLPVSLVVRKYKLNSDRDAKRKALTTLEKSELYKKYFLKDANVATTIKYLENQISHIDQQLSNFTVADDYHAVQTESNRVYRELRSTRNQLSVVNNALAQIQGSLKERRDVAPEKVKQLYSEADLFLPELVTKRIDEVIDFHKRLLKNRFDRLDRERTKLQAERNELDEKIQKLNQESDALLQYLNAHKALDEYIALTKRRTDLSEQHARLKKQSELHNELHGEIRKIEREIFDETDKADEYLKNETQWTTYLMDTFISFARAFYPRKPSGLVITNNDGPNNGIRFNINADIQDDTSEGIGTIKIFCYDMTLLRCALVSSKEHLNQNKIRFIFHDSRIFSGVDSRQAATLFEVAQEVTRQDGTQYIVSINDNTLSSLKEIWGEEKFEKFILDTHTLVLTDESETHKLLGIEVDLKYENAQ